MSNETKHTLTPWTVGIKAVNCYAELVDTLRSCEQILSLIECGHDKPIATGMILDQARAIIAKATGGQQ